MHHSLGPDRILEIGHAFRASKMLLSAVELGVFTALAEGPLDLEALRQQVGIHARGARDFLDALVALGMLDREADGCYCNSPETDRYLDRNKPTYIGGLLERLSVEQYGIWSALTAAVRTGKPQSDKTMVSNFAPLYADKRSRDLYVGGMSARTHPAARALAGAVVNSWAKPGRKMSRGIVPAQVAKAVTSTARHLLNKGR